MLFHDYLKVEVKISRIRTGLSGSSVLYLYTDYRAKFN